MCVRMPVHDVFVWCLFISSPESYRSHIRLSVGMWKLGIKPGSREQLLLLLFDPSLLPQRSHFTCLYPLTLLSIFYRNYVNLQHSYEQERLQTFKISIKYNKIKWIIHKFSEVWLKKGLHLLQTFILGFNHLFPFICFSTLYKEILIFIIRVIKLFKWTHGSHGYRTI